MKPDLIYLCRGAYVSLVIAAIILSLGQYEVLALACIALAVIVSFVPSSQKGASDEPGTLPLMWR